MTEFLYIVFGCLIVFALWFPVHVARQERRNIREEVQKSLSERGAEAVLGEIDAEIRERLDYYAESEKNAGVLHASGADDLLGEVHGELVLLNEKRKIVVDHIKNTD